MRKSREKWCSVSVAIILVCVCVKSVVGTAGNSLLVISYDAFRNDYLRRNVTPHLNSFRNEGISVPFMRNVFPTKTFPNHHTIATGVYPEVHGVTANSVFDRVSGKKLEYGYPLFHYTEDVIPIWTLNELRGQYSGCMMWPGSDFAYSGRNCTYTVSYNRFISWDERVDIAMSWLRHKEKPARLVMMYFEDPDTHGHIYGPDSSVISDLIVKLDNLTASIQQKLKALNLADRVNVIHLSDHGMEGVASAKFIDLRKFVTNGTCDFYGTSPVLQVVPIAGKFDDVYGELKKGAQVNGHFKVYSNGELLKRWHFNNSARTGPITVLADAGYAFQDMYEAAEWYAKKYNVTFTPQHEYGIHGYDNEGLPSMYSMFMAKGPDFQQHRNITPFDTVDLYSLFVRILNLSNPPATNGTLEHVAEALRTSTSTSSGTKKDPKVSAAIVALGSAMVSFSIVSFIATFAVLAVRRRRARASCEEVDLPTSHEVTLLLKTPSGSSSGSSTATDTDVI
ncbi:ectonucleotide pyrophosphatase/phosphodiesterase family member 5-like isoform X1 [Lutzomyia longipalpis]|uniref:ectonucleotide pyrophosphatase/phosphodiesterase family member 5-like isoform X1 n=1 Tax=Lutzomyia longipalpis TaxID=7200 RepID=UPI002483A097|nr:ectonucleotide pyrophosphatase/phosphodiesterase family member 5-like isoform X1 [Lutzomyia longipalpis]